MNNRYFNKKEYQEKFGRPLRMMLLKRWRTIGQAASILDINPDMLSHYFAGRRIPNRNFEDKLRFYGFDMEIFQYLHRETDIKDLPADLRGMTWQQVVWFVEQLKDFIARQDDTIKVLRSAIKAYEERINHLKDLYGR